MSRFLSRSLAVALLTLAGISVGHAEIESVRYLVPVTYDMVITRTGIPSETTNSKGVTTQTSPLSFEFFTSKDLLKLILGELASTDAELKKWALYAEGSSETFTDPKGLESLTLIALKKKDTSETQELPEGMTFSLSLSDVRAYSSAAVHAAEEADDDEDDENGYKENEVLSKREAIAQLATLTQALPARGERSAGTLTTTGYVTHGLVLDEITISGETTATAVNRPTAATYRAAGTFNAETDSEDGLVEVLIKFGTPKLEAVEAPAPVE